MTPRLPTREEQLLWQESNRLTILAQPMPCVLPEEAPPCTPEPSRAAMVEVRPVRRALTPLTPLLTREAKRRFAPYPLQATLDLHGFSKLEAYAQLQQFILAQRHAARRHVRIITGKGRGEAVGVLRHYLPDWLNEPALRPQLAAMAYAPPEKGGMGVLHVLLKGR